MSRHLTIAVAQMGPIPRKDSRPVVVDRLIGLLSDASARGSEFVVFPECALGAFFPHWWIDNQDELDAHFERTMPSSETQPLFDAAARLQVGFCLGYAELATEAGRVRHFNSTVLVERDGRIAGHYRKVHLPGYREHRPGDPFQNLEQRYFEPGNLGFRTFSAFDAKVGMLICNDRRWPESYRVLGLQGCEVAVMGYNTPTQNPEYPETDRLADFHNQLCLQAGAYQNGMWVAAAAKAGPEEGVTQIGGSMIVAPSGEVVARASTLDDELIIHRCDLDACKTYKEGIFPFRNRRVEHYGPILTNPK